MVESNMRSLKKRERLKELLSKNFHELSDEDIDGYLGIREGWNGIPKKKLKEWYGKERFDDDWSSYLLIKKVIEEGIIGDGEVVYDLGSGKGRFVLYSALYSPAKKVVGIEIVKQRAECNMRAAEELGLDNVEIRNTNIVDEDISDADIVYIHGEFSRNTCEKVNEKLRGLHPDTKIIVSPDHVADRIMKSGDFSKEKLFYEVNLLRKREVT